MSTNAIPEHPNLLFIMTDQERFTQHFPDGWEENNLPNMQRLKNNGVTFTKAYTCTSMCSPSRTAMFTGRYPSQTGVTKTLGVGERFAPNKYNPTDIELSPEIPNLATMLHKSGEYGKIGYLGKWHMSKGFDGVQELLPRQIAAYGFSGWVPPDGGQDWRVTNIAGGYFDKDNAYAQEAISFIRDRAKETDGKPWCLVLSLINPHDIWTFPKNFAQTGYGEDMLKGDIGLPETIDEHLLQNRKPLAQAEIKYVQDNFVGGLDTKELQLAYLNFYGNLLKLADGQIGEVLDALEQSGLSESTVIVRTADHGEMGLAHGGLRQKMFNVYEETIHIPMIISSPAINPGRTSEQLISTIDLIPTIAGLLHVDPPKGVQGKDLSAIVLDQPLAPENERTELLFTFDDFRVEANRPSAVEAADRIRCIRTNEWKYARYFHADSSFKEEYEMYNLVTDPLEKYNLAYSTDPAIVKQRDELAAKLYDLEKTELPRNIDNVAHTVKTLTYNIRNWRDDPPAVWERRRTQMIEQFKALNPDVILLQEVCWAINDQNSDNSMILWLRQQLPEYTYVQYADNGMIYKNHNFDPDTNGRDEREGLAIFSKINAQSSQVFKLGTGGDDGNQRICLATYFEQFHLYNCHLSTDEDGRLTNIENFKAQVGADEIGMINGDLNALPKDPIFYQLPAWTDVWDKLRPDDKGLTFEVPICDKKTGPLDERIDYFLAGPKMLKTMQYINTAMNDKDYSGYYSSDHLGVVVDFTVSD